MFMQEPSSRQLLQRSAQQRPQGDLLQRAADATCQSAEAMEGSSAWGKAMDGPPKLTQVDAGQGQTRRIHGAGSSASSQSCSSEGQDTQLSALKPGTPFPQGPTMDVSDSESELQLPRRAQSQDGMWHSIRYPDQIGCEVSHSQDGFEEDRQEHGRKMNPHPEKLSLTEEAASIISSAPVHTRSRAVQASNATDVEGRTVSKTKTYVGLGCQASKPSPRRQGSEVKDHALCGDNNKSPCRGFSNAVNGEAPVEKQYWALHRHKARSKEKGAQTPETVQQRSCHAKEDNFCSTEPILSEAALKGRAARTVSMEQQAAGLKRFVEGSAQTDVDMRRVHGGANVQLPTVHKAVNTEPEFVPKRDRPQSCKQARSQAEEASVSHSAAVRGQKPMQQSKRLKSTKGMLRGSPAISHYKNVMQKELLHSWADGYFIFDLLIQIVRQC